MKAIEIQHNGALLLTVGTHDALMFSINLFVDIEADVLGRLNVRGMRDLGNDRESHMVWLTDISLAADDTLGFQFVETESASPTVEEIASDSEVHRAEQAAYEEEMCVNPPQPRVMLRHHADAFLQVACTDGKPVVARFDEHHEFMMLSLLWNRWRPERCRASLSSTSGREALARTGGKDWLTQHLTIGQRCEVILGRGEIP